MEAILNNSLNSQNYSISEIKDNSEKSLEFASVSAKTEDKVELSNSAKKIKQPEKVMMNLNDMKNFLFMLIGSDIQVESENGVSTGTKFSTIA